MNSKLIISLLFLLLNVSYFVFLYFVFYKDIKNLSEEKEELEKTNNLYKIENRALKSYIEKLEESTYNECKEDRNGIKRSN